MEKEFTKPGRVEYQMPKEMAMSLIKGKNRQHINLQKVLVDYVNTECGLLRHCEKVILV